MKRAIKLSFFLFALFFSFQAESSAVGPVECLMDVSIQKRIEEKSILEGVLTDSKCALNFLVCEANQIDCSSYEGLPVRLSGNTNYEKLMLMRLESIKIGVSRGSSMGPNGPVAFEHWTVLDIVEGGKPVPKETLPLFRVEAESIE